MAVLGQQLEEARDDLEPGKLRLHVGAEILILVWMRRFHRALSNEPLLLIPAIDADNRLDTDENGASKMWDSPPDPPAAQNPPCHSWTPLEN